MLLNCGAEGSWESLEQQGDQPWMFTGRSHVETEAPILCPSDAKSWLIRKDPDAGKDWRQEEKGVTEDKMQWMASPTQQAWVWASSGGQWRTGKPGAVHGVKKRWTWFSDRIKTTFSMVLSSLKHFLHWPLLRYPDPSVFPMWSTLGTAATVTFTSTHSSRWQPRQTEAVGLHLTIFHAPCQCQLFPRFCSRPSQSVSLNRDLKELICFSWAYTSPPRES